MAKNANIRINDANVAYVNIDTETHAMSGGVMDETTGTFYPVGGGSDLFETVELKINSPFSIAYDLMAPVIITEDDDNTIWTVGENLESAEATYNIVIPTNGGTVIQIRPTSDQSEVVIVSGDITEFDSTSFTLTGNAEVTVQLSM